MIAYICGKLSFLSPAYAIMECGGLGYHVHISLNTYSALLPYQEGKEELKLFTYLHIKEDAHTLYGFAEEQERRLFSHLISVSGIGPNTGRLILSSLNPQELEAAIVRGEVHLLKRIKGIGPKSAQRIILELQDKLQKGSKEITSASMPSYNTTREEALSALVMLGFTRSIAEKAVDTVLKNQEGQSVESLIKNALKLL